MYYSDLWLIFAIILNGDNMLVEMEEILAEDQRTPLEIIWETEGECAFQSLKIPAGKIAVIAVVDDKEEFKNKNLTGEDIKQLINESKIYCGGFVRDSVLYWTAIPNGMLDSYLDECGR